MTSESEESKKTVENGGQVQDVVSVQDWISVEDRLPDDDTRVDAKYEGVYHLRENILFWLDVDGKTPHFGGFVEIDGKGSQPATHWRPAH